MVDYNLTQEQVKEIATLTNSGVPHNVIAKGYNTLVSSIDGIYKLREEWLPLEDITNTPEQQFQYAQRKYKSISEARDKFTIGSSNFNIKRYIEDFVFSPIVRKVSNENKQYPKKTSYDPEVGLFNMAFFSIRPKQDRGYLDMARKIYSEILKDKVMLGEEYISIDDVVVSLSSTVREDVSPILIGLDEEFLSLQQKEWRNNLIVRIHEFLDKLTSDERKVIELRYGFKDGNIYKQEDVVNITGLPRSKVSILEWNVLHRLRSPIDSKQIRSMLPEYLLRDIHWF